LGRQAVKFAQRLSQVNSSEKGINMNSAAAIVLGLLIGWLVEWVIDWLYWRGRTRNIASENLHLKERIESLEKEIQRKVKPGKAASLRDRAGQDNLQAIYGIGPAFSKRLNEAGVNTFEQLSRLTARELEEILGTLFKRFFSKENTILAQAKEFAQRKAKQR
jgi:predicted flap endonuclease-1-like 5' DNA nuclease